MLVVVSAGLALTSSAASAAPVSINLCAVTGTATLTGAGHRPDLGLRAEGPDDAETASTATASLPGPSLAVNQGDMVTVNVTNALPAGHTVRFEVPGINFDAGPTDAAVGNTLTRTFTASAAGNLPVPERR